MKTTASAHMTVIELGERPIEREPAFVTWFGLGTIGLLVLTGRLEAGTVEVLHVGETPVAVVSRASGAYQLVNDQLSAILAHTDLDEGEVPTANAKSAARNLMAAFRAVHAVPERIIPDGEGGIAFYMFGRADATGTHRLFGSLIAAEDGSVLLVRGDRAEKRRAVEEVRQDAGSLQEAATILARFVGGDVGART